jgi:hypothetical protein
VDGEPAERVHGRSSWKRRGHRRGARGGPGHGVVGGGLAGGLSLWRMRMRFVWAMKGTHAWAKTATAQRGRPARGAACAGVGPMAMCEVQKDGARPSSPAPSAHDGSRIAAPTPLPRPRPHARPRPHTRTRSVSGPLGARLHPARAAGPWASSPSPRTTALAS